MPGNKLENMADSIVQGAINNVIFPKVMRWSVLNEYYIRPVRWILALLDGNIIHIKRFGIESANVTFGHRYLNGKPMEISSLRKYTSTLREHFVEVSSLKRKEHIVSQIKEVLQKGEKLISMEDDSIQEIANLTEWPNVFVGSYDERFLRLPAFVVDHVIKKYQKCLAIYDKNTNDILPKFIGVSNLPTSDLSYVRKGFERVIRARLEDALFYYDQDLKTPLIKRLNGLKDVVEHEKIGSIFDKVLRLKECALMAINYFNAVHSSWIDDVGGILKCDIVTYMVSEFPELQGMIGREYALKQGLPEVYADAIYEGGLPSAFCNEMPKKPLGLCLSIIDHIDSIVGFALVNLIPSSSQDPYGLRRKASNLARLMIEGKVRLNVYDLIQISLDIYKKYGFNVTSSIKGDIFQFILLRLESFFQLNGYARDTIQSVVARSKGDFLKDERKLYALRKAKIEGNFSSIGINIKRIRNILRENELLLGRIKTMKYYLYGEEEEQLLVSMFQNLEIDLHRAEVTMDYEPAMKTLADLRDILEQFFSVIMVNVNEPKIRERRVALLAHGYRLVDNVIDFSKLIIQKHQ